MKQTQEFGIDSFVGIVYSSIIVNMNIRMFSNLSVHEAFYENEMLADESNHYIALYGRKNCAYEIKGFVFL